MKLSCAVFDMDGTLLTPDNKISETDLKTLHRLSDDGVKIVIATGRCELQIKEYIAMLNIADPIITCNGSVIMNPATREVISEKFIKPSIAEGMLSAFDKDGTDYLIYTSDYVYYTHSSARVNFIMEYNETAPEEYRVPLRPSSEYPKELRYENIIKILVIDNLKRMPELNGRFNNEGDLTLVTSGLDPVSGRELIDIMPANCSKGSAIKILADYLGIPISEVAAFGDSPNDEDMLRAAGFSVAMGNAVESIKQVADFVTLRNDENGITYALEHITKKL